MTGVDSKGAFFAAVRSALPLDPSLISARSWDALSDSLFGGLLAQPEQDLVLAFSDVSAFAAAAPDDLATASAVLLDVAQTLADERATGGAPKRVSVYWVGSTE